MASEDRPKFLSVLLVLCVAFQVFAGTTAAVIQHDGGERSAALRAPKLCVQLLRGAPHV